MARPVDVGTTSRGSMSRSRRLRIWEANGGICVLCGQKIDGVRQRWIVEHIRALELGGEDTDANCGPAHEYCAAEKTRIDHITTAKAKRIKARHLGIRKPTSRPLPGTRASGIRKRMNRTVERWPS